MEGVFIVLVRCKIEEKLIRVLRNISWIYHANSTLTKDEVRIAVWKISY